MARVGCSICESDNREDIEVLGVQALRGELSWRKATEQSGVYHHNALKNHMEKHFIAEQAAERAEVDDEFDELVRDSIRELHVQMRLAPPEVKAFYAVAIANLQELKNTKPSQANLLAALKGIHEVTGMKQGQQMMLQFAESMFREMGKAEPAKAIPAVIDVEPED